MTSKLSGLCYIQITSTALEIGMNFFFLAELGFGLRASCLVSGSIFLTTTLCPDQ
jgi:hypothetical protein